MKSLDMEYNSGRPNLIIPEYGRNVQKLIRKAKEIEDGEERQQFIERVVDLMMQMSPQSKNLDDFKERLWRHVFRIGGYDLEVLPPTGIKPTPEDEIKKPEQVGYPQTEARFKHYGNNVQNLVKKALEMEDGPIKDGFVEVIGNYMKLAYKTWNREHYVSDDLIIQDLKTLSGDKLEVKEDASLDTLANANRRKKRGNSNSNNNNSSGGGKRRRRRK